MSARITILIAENHALLRDGMRSLLSQVSDFEIVGEAATGKDAIALACTARPALVLMDLALPGIDGLDAIAEIHRRVPDIKVLVVTMHKADECIHRALRVGARGYFSKDSNYKELLTAIRTVLLGKIYLSADISERVVNNYFSGDAKSASDQDKLSIREREVLKLIAEGNSNKHMANYLNLSVKTVEKHRASLRHKLGLRNASMLTAYAIEKGIVTRLSQERVRDLEIDS